MSHASPKIDVHRRSTDSIHAVKKKLAIALLDATLRIALFPIPRKRTTVSLRDLRPRRILVARPDHIGDAILATPTLRAVRRRYPDAELTFAVASWSAPLFAHDEHIDHVFVIDPPWWIAKRKGRVPIPERIRIWRRFLARLIELRDRRFDLCIELRGDVRQIVAFGWFLRPAALVACRRNGGHFLADAWSPPAADRHEALQDLDIAALTGCDIDDPEPRIDPGRPARDTAAALLREHGLDDGRFVVVLHPSAKRANAWPVAHFRALLDRMMHIPGLGVLITGAEGERQMHRELEAAGPGRIASVAGLPLPVVSALLERADLFVGADTGPMHLLNGIATRSVLLFGPTKPARFAPFGERHRIVAAGWCCDENLHDVCHLDPHAAHGRCMASIGVERVFDAVSEIVAEIEHERGRADAAIIAATASP
jgi:ADP-heptose:LPS heptosyltransferase